VLAAAESLRRLGASAVVASLGRTGSVAVTPAGRWRVSHPRLDGNPVGPGDALVAGLALGTVLGTADWTAADWTAALARATGLAMASVLSPSAGGEADPAEATRLAESVRIRKIGKLRT
jgi:tagatose 6-phosphate kinase